MQGLDVHKAKLFATLLYFFNLWIVKHFFNWWGVTQWEKYIFLSNVASETQSVKNQSRGPILDYSRCSYFILAV